MTDGVGHQLPKVIHKDLDEAELMDWVERFYSEYYFRPRVIWRVVRKALWNSHDRKRLMKEAREYAWRCGVNERNSSANSAISLPLAPMPVTSFSDLLMSWKIREPGSSGRELSWQLEEISVDSRAAVRTLLLKTRILTVIVVLTQVLGDYFLSLGLHQIGSLVGRPSTQLSSCLS